MMDRDRGYEYKLVAILFFAWGTVFLDRMSQFYLGPYFAPEFQLSHGQIGVLASVLAISWAISTLFFGALSDRIGRKRILIPAIFAFSALSWVSGVVRSYHELLLVRALMGFAEGPTWSIITALIEESAPKDRRGTYIGIVVSGAAFVGLAAAPILTTQVAARVGWRWAFFVAGVPGLLIAMLIWAFVLEPRGTSRGEYHGHKIALRDYFSILRHRNMWLCCAGAAGFMSWLFLENVFAPLYITEVAHQSGTTMGRLLFATGLGSFFLGLSLPGLSDRWGRKPVLYFMAVLCLFVPLSLLVTPLYAHPWVLAAVLFLTNAGQGVGALILVLVPTESVPPQFAATSIGLATLVGEIFGATVAPTIGGAVAQAHGLAAPLWMSAGGMALVFLVTIFLKETAQQRVSRTELQPITSD
jgi:predicted MFS family arabinose efflux permease